MARTVTLTRSLKLRISDDLTSDSIYNLNKIDSLGSIFNVDTNSDVRIRSKHDILIEPESADVGGSGLGGAVSISTPDHPIALNAYVSTLTLVGNSVVTGDFKLNNPLSLKDQASGGSKVLKLLYKSDAVGSTDSSEDRQLTLDVNEANRLLSLEGDLKTVGGTIQFTTPSSSILTLPLVGTLSTLAGVEVLTHKTINAPDNTITNISNTSIAADAAIAYSKLNLTAHIIDNDISPDADIDYSKLDLGGRVKNSDIASDAAIVYSKLNLEESIVNADISELANIHYNKLNLVDKIKNTDIKFNAAIDATKIANGSVSNTAFQYLAGADSNIQQQINDIQIRGGVGREKSYQWLNTDGATKTVTHGYDNVKIQIEILDNDSDYDTIEVESIERDVDSITFTASSAPVTAWTILLKEIPA